MYKNYDNVVYYRQVTHKIGYVLLLETDLGEIMGRIFQLLYFFQKYKDRVQ